MITPPDNKSGSLTFARSYAKALKRRLGDPAKPDPVVTRKLGLRVSKLGVPILELARIHEAAILQAEIPGESGRSRSTRIRRGESFFEATVAVIEQERFAASPENRRQLALIENLTLRIEGLAASNSQLHDLVAQGYSADETPREGRATSRQLPENCDMTQVELRRLSRRILDAQEDDRTLISRELHDVIAQTLAGITVRLAILRSLSTANTDALHEKIEGAERLVQHSVEIVHQFASDLRPFLLDDLGLAPALRSFSDAFSIRTHIPVSLATTTAVEKLDSHARTALFRIAEEALANVENHAQADKVKIDLRAVKGVVRMTIRDDGKGFSPAEACLAANDTPLGMLGMGERAQMVGGTFTIDSTLGKGTSIQVDVPIGPPPPEELATATTSPTNTTK